MRPRISVALTALVLLFFLEAHRDFAALLLGGAAVPPPAGSVALLSLVLLFLPLLPVTRWWSRPRLVVATAVSATVLRLALAAAAPHPALQAPLAALTMAGAALYLGVGVGLVPRRSLAGGAALAVLLDVASRWAAVASAGSGSPAVGLALTLAALLATLAWVTPRATVDDDAATLERRAGGLRSRGAIAFGAIAFLEGAVLANPDAGVAATGRSFSAVAAALAVVALGAALWLLGGGGPARFYRPRLVAMGGAAAAAAALASRTGAVVAGVLLPVGHVCALLLLGRALAPASGRREPSTIVAGLIVLVLLDAMLALARSRGGEAAAWLALVAAGVLLTAALLLIPRPRPAGPLVPRAVGRVALAVSLLTAALLLLAGR
ncbi:MAG: hypothetical protein IRZ00_05285 [Gemmatimonadetes bacterium]|nr:hypothetical protein [Gemmatimonadota bacterium]